MPELNVARKNSSCFVLGDDNLYVLGGEFENPNLAHNCVMIEKLNLKQSLNITKFE